LLLLKVHVCSSILLVLLMLVLLALVFPVLLFQLLLLLLLLATFWMILNCLVLAFLPIRQEDEFTGSKEDMLLFKLNAFHPGGAVEAADIAAPAEVAKSDPEEPGAFPANQSAFAGSHARTYARTHKRSHTVQFSTLHYRKQTHNTTATQNPTTATRMYHNRICAFPAQRHHRHHG